MTEIQKTKEFKMLYKYSLYLIHFGLLKEGINYKRICEDWLKYKKGDE